MRAFYCPNVWNLWIIPSIEVCYSDLQGLFLQNIIFLVQTLWKDQCGSVLPHVTVLLVFFLTFLNFKLRTYLFNRHFTWLIILFSKLTKNIFYFNKFFLSKFESNLTGSTFSYLLISKNTKLYWYFKVVLNFKYIIGVIWGFWLNSTLTSKYFWILHPKLISFWYEIRS